MAEVPDILVLSAETPTRALLCAQLIEEGYEVVPAAAWPVPRQYFRLADKPRVVIVDLHALPDPQKTLDEVPALAAPDRVLVIAALGTVSPDALRARGFRVITRPATIGEIVSAARQLVETARAVTHRSGNRNLAT